MKNNIKKLVPSILTLAALSQYARADDLPYICKPKDPRYAIRITETSEKKPLVVLLKKVQKSEAFVPVEKFSGEYLTSFYRATLSIFAVGESTNTELRLITDPLLMGTLNFGDGEGNEKWKGRVYLNKKLTSIIEGVNDDTHPVQSPADVVCETEI